MAQTPKYFQRITAEVAVKALTTGSRRFLLADEVGLGKTIVAREVIAQLARRHGDRPFRVYYFGSGRTVTAQNAPRLCTDVESGLCDANRPGLMALSDIPKTNIVLFQFTPETAVPHIHGRGRTGVALERALLRVLVSKVLRCPLPRNEAVRKAFQGAASEEGFGQALRRCRQMYRDGRLLRGHALSDAFQSAVREVFGAGDRKHLPRLLTDKIRSDAKLCVALLREALTRASLRCLPPHLIVFDEFHKYRNRVFTLPGEPDEHVFLSLLSSDTRPAVLLLSATPFRQERGATRGNEVHADAGDFHRLVGFLHGSGADGETAYRKCAGLFGAFERALVGGRLEEIGSYRRALEEQLLRPRMARMERGAFRNADHAPSAGEQTHGKEFPAQEDLDLFLRFAAALDLKDKPAALAYWRAVPYPHQFLGIEYVAWKRAARSKWRDLTGITAKQRSGMRMRYPVPHLRFRKLLDLFPPERLALPWMAPSMPWWALRGPWALESPSTRGLEKGLLFSAYRAAPRAIAGLMSFAVENWAAREQGWADFKKLNKRSFLAPKSVSVVALFHPSQWLAEIVDPLAATDRSQKSLMSFATKSIRAFLPPGVKYEHRSKRHRPLWRVLPMLERAADRGPRLPVVWCKAVPRDFRGQLGRALDRMEDAARTAERTVSSAELKDLAWFSLSAPGVVLLRALRRNWAEVATEAGLAAITDLSWNGVRPYLDRPWFVARLMKGRISGYPDAIQRAVVEGNLESVLDEHFWLPDPDHEHWLDTGRNVGRLSALRNTLSVRSAPVKVISPGNPRRAALALSAHAVLPLSDTEAHTAGAGGVKQLRANDLRQAFNTPFWPHVLCTTSVGQEGLDFHQWCRCVIHWDLCSSPVDMEQREGRIDRFKSLAVRRALADQLNGDGPTVWTALEGRAQRIADESGLSPWWVLEGARMEKWSFDPPSSEERAHRERLSRLRELYRLVLGLPHSEDLLSRLDAMGLSAEAVRNHCLDLGALRRTALSPQPLPTDITGTALRAAQRGLPHADRSRRPPRRHHVLEHESRSTRARSRDS